MELTYNKGTRKGDYSYYMIKEDCPINIWEYAMNNSGGLPLDYLSKIDKAEYEKLKNSGKAVEQFIPLKQIK